MKKSTKVLHEIRKSPSNNRFLHNYLLKYEEGKTGEKIDYEVVSRNPDIKSKENLGDRTNAVCIVPVFEDGTVLAIREYRFAIGDYCLEFPAGIIDEDETAEEAAIRELKEETGLDTVRILAAIPGGYSSTGMTDEKVAIVVVEVSGNFRETEEGREEIHPFRTTYRELWKLCQTEKCSGRLQCFLAGMMFLDGTMFADAFTGRERLIAYDIEWDIDEEDYESEDVLPDLPTEMEIPDDIDTDDGISDWLSDFTGFCHHGFKVRRLT